MEQPNQQPIQEKTENRPPTKTFLIVAVVAVILTVGGVLLLQNIKPAPPSPMETVTISRCDVNADGQCDAADQVLFQQALGKHRGDLDYNPIADADADGVVTAIDQQMLFPVTSPVPSLQPQTEVLNTSTWQTYRNDEFGFEVKYPSLFKIAEQDTNGMKAGDKIPFEQSFEDLVIRVITKPLSEIEYTAEDGILAPSIYKFSRESDQWYYVGTTWGDFRPEDDEYLRKEGGSVPEKYHITEEVDAWVAYATDIHSTEGGNSWQTAYIESSDKKFTVTILLSRCSSAERREACAHYGDYDLLTNAGTISTVLSTFRFAPTP
jgi:hypothetical protein